jgi:hypothetical protein
VGTPYRRGPRRHAFWALGLTVLLHLAALLLVVQQRNPRVEHGHADSRRLQVRLIADAIKPIAPQPIDLAVPPLHAKAPVRSRTMPRVARPTPAPADEPARITVAQPAEAPADTLPAPAAAPWLDPEKTRQVLRAHARDVPIAEQAVGGASRRVTSTERFGAQVQSSATGDCLKSEFMGGNLGILSLPFWALAEVRGKCRR